MPTKALNRFTVFGANGFIGSNLVRRLQAEGIAVDAIGRSQWPTPGADLGHAIYAIGLTADFRIRMSEVVEAHIGALSRILRDYCFQSILYLSSARIYIGALSSSENVPISVSPLNSDHLYNISKLMGESLILSHSSPRARVVRLSNVIGAGDSSENFLNSVIAEGVTRGEVTFRTDKASERDFVSVQDVCDMIVAIALRGERRLYNLASGKNVSNAMIARLLNERGIKTSFLSDAPKVNYPILEVGAIRQEFGFEPKSFETCLNDMVTAKAEMAVRS